MFVDIALENLLLEIPEIAVKYSGPQTNSVSNKKEHADKLNFFIAFPNML